MKLLEIITEDATYHTSVKDLEEELKVLDELHEKGFIKLKYLEEKIDIKDIEQIRTRDWEEVI